MLNDAVDPELTDAPKLKVTDVEAGTSFEALTEMMMSELWVEVIEVGFQFPNAFSVMKGITVPVLPGLGLGLITEQCVGKLA